MVGSCNRLRKYTNIRRAHQRHALGFYGWNGENQRGCRRRWEIEYGEAKGMGDGIINDGNPVIVGGSVEDKLIEGGIVVGTVVSEDGLSEMGLLGGTLAGSTLAEGRINVERLAGGVENEG